MTKLAECFCFDLTDTLTGDIELFSDLFQCTCSSITHTKTQAENFSLSLSVYLKLHPAVLSEVSALLLLPEQVHCHPG